MVLFVTIICFKGRITELELNNETDFHQMQPIFEMHEQVIWNDHY